MFKAFLQKQVLTDPYLFEKYFTLDWTRVRSEVELNYKSQPYNQTLLFIDFSLV